FCHSEREVTRTAAGKHSRGRLCHTGIAEVDLRAEPACRKRMENQRSSDALQRFGAKRQENDRSFAGECRLARRAGCRGRMENQPSSDALQRFGAKRQEKMIGV